MRVAAAGVCHSDVHLADGVLGDGSLADGARARGRGRRRGGRARRDARAARATGSPSASCPRAGAALPAVPGRTTLCDVAGANIVRGTLMDGTSRLHDADGETLQHGLMVACFSERVVIDGASAVPLPPALPLWQAALLGCAVVTGVGAVRNVARVRIGETACVDRLRRRRAAGHLGPRALGRSRASSRSIATRRSSTSRSRAARRTGCFRVRSRRPRCGGSRAARGSITRSRSWDAARRSGSPGTRCGRVARPSSSGSRRAAWT